MFHESTTADRDKSHPYTQQGEPAVGAGFTPGRASLEH
jgi:hypothetical protein